MQKLLVLQSLWAMEGLRDAPIKRSLEDDIKRIKGAGFDGISAMWEDDATCDTIADVAAFHGLVVEGTCIPTSLAEFELALERVERHPLHHLNVQLKILPTRLDDAARLLAQLQLLSKTVSFPVYFETHRGRITNDLLVMVQLLDMVPDTKLLVDLSHYVVAREIELPIDAVTEQHIATILHHAWAFHGRIAGSGQIQLPFSFAHHRPWVEQFTAWWSKGFADWRDRAVDDAELTFVCELGPQPYAISGADGRDLSDRWEESILLKRIAEAAWQSGIAA